jgi:phage gp29-like protein
MDIEAILRESAAYFEALEEEGFDSSVEFKTEDDPIDPILTQLKPIGDATFAEWFEQLQGLMQESDNLTEFRDKLTEAYPDLDASEFKQAMLDASLLASLKGYDDAK